MNLKCWLRGHDSIRATAPDGERIFVCQRCGYTEPVIDRTGEVLVPRLMVKPEPKPEKPSNVTPIRRAR